MEQTLQDQLLETIRKSLPAHLSDELRKELSELAALRRELPELREKHTVLKRELSVYKAKEHENDVRENNNIRKERELGDVERRLAALDTTLKCEKEKVQLVQDMFKTVFANNTLRTNVMGTVPVGVPAGGYPSSSSVSTSTEQQG